MVFTRFLEANRKVIASFNFLKVYFVGNVSQLVED